MMMTIERNGEPDMIKKNMSGSFAYK